MRQERIVEGRRVAALGGLFVGPILLAAGEIVRPVGEDGPAALAGRVAAAPDLWLIGWSLTLVGAASMVPGLGVLLGRVKDRGAALGTIGFSLFGLGLIGLVGLSASELLLVPVLGAGGDDAAGVALVERMDSSAALAVVFALYLPGIFFGIPLAFGGLVRAGEAPFWTLAVALGSVAATFVLGDLLPLSGVWSWALMVAAFTGTLAHRSGRTRRALVEAPASA